MDPQSAYGKFKHAPFYPFNTMSGIQENIKIDPNDFAYASSSGRIVVMEWIFEKLKKNSLADEIIFNKIAAFRWSAACRVFRICRTL
jgi:hypothetical protein